MADLLGTHTSHLLIHTHTYTTFAHTYIHGTHSRLSSRLHFCTDPGTNIQQLLLVTMISRVAKILLRSLMRNINSTNDAPFFEAIVEYAFSAA